MRTTIQLEKIFTNDSRNLTGWFTCVDFYLIVQLSSRYGVYDVYDASGFDNFRKIYT